MEGRLRAMEAKWRGRAKALLAVITVLLVHLLWSWLYEEPYASVCLVNLANNPRTASIFSRGILEEHGSRNTFKVVKATENCDPRSTRLNLVSTPMLLEWCLGEELCIVTGDEDCNAPGPSNQDLHKWLLKTKLFQAVPQEAAKGYRRHLRDEVDFAEESFLGDLGNLLREGGQQGLEEDLIVEAAARLRPHIILREFYSSVYDYPSVPLGARYEFSRVPQQVRDQGERRFLFNFMGSIKVGLEPDREHLRDVINGNTWTQPTHVKMFTELVRNPNSTTVDEYRNTLLSSSFTLAPVGTADDCFRFWEAIEAGSIPIFVRRMPSSKPPRCPDAFEDVLRERPPIVLLEDWDQLPKFASTITESKVQQLREKMVVWSKKWWTNVAKTVDDAILEGRQKMKEAAQRSDDSVEKLANRVADVLSSLKRLQVVRKEMRHQRKAGKKRKQKNPGATPVGAVVPDKKPAEIRNAIVPDSLQPKEKMYYSGEFDFVHEVLLEVLGATEYRAGFFSDSELDRGSAYMSFKVNRIAFVQKLFSAVCDDMNLAADYFEPEEILNGADSAKTRKFILFLGQAALQSTQTI